MATIILVAKGIVGNALSDLGHGGEGGWGHCCGKSEG